MLLLLGAARCNSDRPFIAIRPIIAGTVYNVVTVMLLLLLSLVPRTAGAAGSSVMQTKALTEYRVSVRYTAAKPQPSH